MDYDIFDIDPLGNTIFDEIRYDNYLMEEAYNDGIKFYEDTLNQASTNRPDKSENIFKKLWNAAVQFIKWIGRILGKIKNFLFGSKAPKQSMNSVVDAAASKSNNIKSNPAIDNLVSGMKSWGSSLNNAINTGTNNTGTNNTGTNKTGTNNTGGNASAISNVIPNATTKSNGIVKIPEEVINNDGTTTTIDFYAILNPVKMIFSDNKPFIEFEWFSNGINDIAAVNKHFVNSKGHTVTTDSAQKLRTDAKNTDFLEKYVYEYFYWLKPKSNLANAEIEHYEKMTDAIINNNVNILNSIPAIMDSYDKKIGQAVSLDRKYLDCQIKNIANRRFVQMPINIPLIQERIERVSKVVEKFRDFDISIYSKNTSLKKSILEFMNDVTTALSRLQMGFNSIMTLFAGIYHIDASYYGCIHTKEDLAIMAEEIVKAAIPTKWAYNNIVLLCDENLRGIAKAYDPAIGQSRVVIFPKNEGNNVIKVAGNRMGLDANRSEYNTSNNLVDKYDLGKYLAKVNWISDNGMVITMEKGVENATDEDEGEARALKDNVNNILKIQGETMRIGDIHSGNVMYFSPGKRNLKAVDYGMQSI